jgi:thymidylate kinase
VLDRSARGDNDLDLLVSRADMQRFTEILYRLGFKEARVLEEQQLPGILNYYGYDKEAGRFIHVHAHCQLVLGHDRTKNYRLPIEEPFLESATQGDLFKVPTPEFEFIVFVMRMILKYSTWDVIIGRQGRVPDASRQELAYLQSLVSWSGIYDLLEQYLPLVDTALFDACMKSLRPDCPIWARIKVGQQLQRKLRAQARRAQILDIYVKLWRRISRGLRRRVCRGLPKKRLVHGGAIIALVGGDGAGKSTAVDGLYTWLAKEFGTIKIHLGKPPWSWTTYTVRAALKVGGFLNPRLHRKTSLGSAADATLPALPGYAQMLWHVCAARDRYWTYVKARRFATNGGIVVCDRFPLSHIKLMDRPQLEQTVDAAHMHWLFQRLVRFEKSCYLSIMPPELLIVLRVEPEVAVQRKTDEAVASVQARSQEIWEMDWRHTRAHMIDASRSRAEVLSELKSLVWSVI